MMRSSETPETRGLAKRLLAYEAVDAGTAMGDEQAVCRVCEKIRRPLTTLAGAAGFRSLLSRSLNLAQKESPMLARWEVRSDGSLQGLSGATAESGAVLIAQLVGLMFTFIGESLTLRLLHDIWVDMPATEAPLERNESK